MFLKCHLKIDFIIFLDFMQSRTSVDYVGKFRRCFGEDVNSASVEQTRFWKHLILYAGLRFLTCVKDADGDLHKLLYLAEGSSSMV